MTALVYVRHYYMEVGCANQCSMLHPPHTQLDMIRGGGADPSDRAGERVDRCILFYIFVNSLHYLHSPQSIFSLFSRLFTIYFNYYHLPSLFYKPIFYCVFLIIRNAGADGSAPSNHRTTHQTSPHTHRSSPPPLSNPHPSHPTPLPSLGQRSRYNSTVHSTTYQGFNFQPFSRPCRL